MTSQKTAAKETTPNVAEELSSGIPRTTPDSGRI